MLSEVNKLERSLGDAGASSSAPNTQPATYVPPRLAQLRSLYSAEQDQRVTATLEKALLASHYGSASKMARSFEQVFSRAQLVPHDSSLNRTQQRQKLDAMFQDFSAEYYRDPLLTRCRDFVSNNKIVTLAALLCVAASSFEVVRRINLPDANIPAEKSNQEIFRDYEKSMQYRPASMRNEVLRPDCPPLEIELNDYGLGKGSLAQRVWMGSLYSPFGPVHVRYQGEAKVVGAAVRFDQCEMQAAPIGYQVNFRDPQVQRSAIMQREIQSVVIPPAGQMDLELCEFHDLEAQTLASYWQKIAASPAMLAMKLDQFVIYLSAVSGKDMDQLEDILVRGAKLDPRTASSYLGVINADNSNELVCSILHKAGYAAAMNYGYQLDRVGLNNFENKWVASEVLINTQSGLLRYDTNRRFGKTFKDLVFTDEDRSQLFGLAMEVAQSSQPTDRKHKLEKLSKLLSELLEGDKYKEFIVPSTLSWSEEGSREIREDCVAQVDKNSNSGTYSNRDITWRRSFRDPLPPFLHPKVLLIMAALAAAMVVLNRANRRRITEKTMQLYRATKEQRDADWAHDGVNLSSPYEQPVELLSKSVQIQVSRQFYNSVNPIAETTTSRADHILFYKCLAAVWLTRRRTILPTWPKEIIEVGEQLEIVKAKDRRSEKFWNKLLKDDRQERLELNRQIAQDSLSAIYARLKFDSPKVLFTALKKCLGITTGQSPTSARMSFKRRSMGELTHVKSADVKSVNWRRTAGIDSGFYINSAPESQTSESIKLNAYVNIDDTEDLATLVGTLVSASFCGVKLHGRVRFFNYGEKLPQEFDLNALQARAGVTLASTKKLLDHLINIFADQTCWYVASSKLSQIPHESILNDRGPKLLYGLNLVEVPNAVGLGVGYLGDDDKGLYIGIVNGVSELKKLKSRLD